MKRREIRFSGKKLSLIPLLLVFFLGMHFYHAPPAQAQPSVTCTGGTDDECHNAGLPLCWECVNFVCVPSQIFCDDGNPCTSEECDPNPQFPPPINQFLPGCIITPLFPTGDGSLPPECFVCEPTENNVTINNGVCDSGAGENCNNSPVDCLDAPDCVFPNSPIPNPVCDISPNDPPIEWGPCFDGDLCTDNLCSFDIPSDDFICTNPAKTCNSTSDACCPAGCVGPPLGDTCPVAVATNCDPDCWPPQECGDEVVQPPETCDDSVPGPDAGVRPNGQAVDDATCRDQGAVAECTYCGDNIIQTAAGEQCDGTQVSACGEGGTCNTDCTCAEQPPTGVCLTGSGNIWDTVRADCADCQLNKNALPGGFLKDYAAYLGLGLILFSGLWLRRRRG